jgi:diguanylate cyclase (GGDEF)-like protein
MKEKPIKTLLIVEDNAGDARLLREMLDGGGSRTSDLTHVENMKDAEKHLLTNYVDIILLDLGLPDTQGLEAVRRTRAAAPNAVLVVMTGFDDESMAEQTLKEGAQDYLVKGQIDSRGLLRAMRYAIQRKAMEDIAATEKRLMTHSAQHDFLTGLPNRMLLHDRLRQAISVAPRHKKKVALLFLDLDGFKQINDSMGHLTGDKLLQSIATRLLECVRGSDTVSRQGGDEFVVLLSEVEQAEGAAITARRMLERVGDPHFIDPHVLHVTSSIGVSVYPDHGTDAETLIQNADFAMYTAKQNGRKNYQFFVGSKDEGAEVLEPKDANSRRKILAPDMGPEMGTE